MVWIEHFVLPSSRSWLFPLRWAAKAEIAIDRRADDPHRAGDVSDLHPFAVQGDDALVAGEDGGMPPQAVLFLPLLPRLPWLRWHGGAMALVERPPA